MYYTNDNYIMRSLMICTLHSEMGGACSTYGGEERCIQGFGGQTLGKETTCETHA